MAPPGDRKVRIGHETAEGRSWCPPGPACTDRRASWIRRRGRREVPRRGRWEVAPKAAHGGRPDRRGAETRRMPVLGIEDGSDGCIVMGQGDRTTQTSRRPDERGTSRCVETVHATATISSGHCRPGQAGCLVMRRGCAVPTVGLTEGTGGGIGAGRCRIRSWSGMPRTSTRTVIRAQPLVAVIARPVPTEAGSRR